MEETVIPIFTFGLLNLKIYAVDVLFLTHDNKKGKILMLIKVEITSFRNKSFRYWLKFTMT